MNKKGLGKGLGAIFGDAADPVNTAVEPVRSEKEGAASERYCS